MKTLINFCFPGMASLLLFTACSIDDPFYSAGDTTSFARAEMYYYHDDFVEGIGSYGIALYNGDRDRQFTELYLDFASDHFEDALRAIPAEGVYTFSDDFSQFTFNNAYSGYTESDGANRTKFGILGGKFTLSRSDRGYLLRFEVKLGNGKTMKGSYDGVILGMYDSTIDSDMHLDFDAMNNGEAEIVGIEPGVWGLLLSGKPEAGAYADKVRTLLTINSEEFPVGHFPMAKNVRQGVNGTAEPASAYYADIEGSHFVHSDGRFSWAVTGEGFVDITDTDEGYTVSFSFEDSNGYTVSGQYTGAISR